MYLIRYYELDPNKSIFFSVNQVAFEALRFSFGLSNPSKDKVGVQIYYLV